LNSPTPSDDPSVRTGQRRTLAAASTAHALHDGFTDMIYVLLPVWQTEFALGYGLLGLLRGLYSGAMAGLQVLAASLALRWGSVSLLVAGTALAALGFGLAGLTTGLLGLCAALVLSGMGSSTQHPLASAAVARAYGEQARAPLGIYNFGGDVGKAALPAALALLLTFISWRSALGWMAGLGLLVTLGLALFMPRTHQVAALPQRAHAQGHGEGGFGWLLLIGILDSATRMGFLTFLPFLLQDKGASMPLIGLGLALVFMGGAFGKFVCGWLGERMGLVWVVLVTEGGSALAIVAVLFLPLTASLFMLPVLGTMLNGTSSVLYGTVPELSRPEKIERAFSLFYTGTIGSGALAPIAFGFLGDLTSVQWATVGTALTALTTLPLAMHLQRHYLRTPART
jgi:FSR family fosmidomycin resistance protein-like MFS transporter